MERVRSKSIYALLAAAVLVTLVVPIGFAGAASDRDPTASGGVKKQIKSLKRQVSQLQQQVEDVSKQPGPQGPEGPRGAEGPPGPATGPAGGDLTGTFPNPLIGPDAVGSVEIAGNAVTSPKIANSAVGSAELGFAAVGTEELQSDTVGADALKDVHAVVGPGVTVSAGTSNDAAVQCPPGEHLIAGGYAWQDEEPNSIIFSAPYEPNPDEIWVVRGIVDAGSNTLFAWANCLAR